MDAFTVSEPFGEGVVGVAASSTPVPAGERLNQHYIASAENGGCFIEFKVV